MSQHSFARRVSLAPNIYEMPREKKSGNDVSHYITHVLALMPIALFEKKSVISVESAHLEKERREWTDSLPIP